ncbi:cupin domain-containing protein [Stappia stellulata]|uniref:cupin domain-containing protein n=1 Tax=Stappia stellulata TaxID=71235 RepID=UPI001CD4C2CB|nr:cupin domain-containing protein [Stappia stellulata]MCA1244454.1 cupin domain-containing protein [Stappia stellulata]
MPKIDIDAIPTRTMTIYPAPFDALVAGRAKQALGNAGGLTQFGVNLTRLKPGAISSLKHWHENEDEFVFILEGEAVLVEDDTETPLVAGEAAAFKAGNGIAHQLVNRSAQDVVYLEVGSRAEEEHARYADHDLDYRRDAAGHRFTRKDGTPY